MGKGSIGRQRVTSTLRTLALFAGGTAEEIAKLADFSQLRHLGRGQRLFSRHERCVALFHVCRGLVKLTRSGRRGGERVIDIAGAGRLLGLSALFSGSGYPFDATAVDDCELVVIQAGPLLGYLETHPRRLMRLATELGRRHERMVGRVDQFIGRNALQRVAHYLLESSEPDDAGLQPPALLAGVRRADVANMLGLTPETFSRTLGRLRRARCIRDQDGTVQVVDRERLAELLLAPSRTVARHGHADGTPADAPVPAAEPCA